jgi:hypothetical protein
MSVIAPARGRNGLLDQLSPEHQARIIQNAQVFRFVAGQRLDTELDGGAVFLPTSGALSVRVTDGQDRGTEVALIGKEGAIGPGRALQPEPLEVVAMTRGEAWRYRPRPGSGGYQADDALNEALVAYRDVFALQMAYSALAAARCSVAARLARWLVMCFDRIEGEAVYITHEALAEALGVRRPGITVATHEIEGIGAIRARRGVIHLLDRAALEGLVPDCYAEPERAYRRLFPAPLRAAPAIAEAARAGALAGP